MSKAKAEELLEEATEAEDTMKLLKAVGWAKEAGVEEGTLAKAVKLMQRLEIGGALKRAVKNENIIELKQLMARAKTSGVDAATTDQGQKLMDMMEKERELRVAMNLGQIEAVRWALENSTAGVRDSTLREARLLERTLEIKGAVASALRSKNVSKIEVAIQQGELGGVETAYLAEAREKLAQLKAREKPREAASKDNKLEGSDMLSQAMRMRRPDLLKISIKQALDDGLPYAEVEAAEHLLAEIEADKACAAALRTKDKKKLQDAVNKADAFRVQGGAAEQARSLLARMEVEAVLATAMKEREPAALKEAIDKARRASVDKMHIDTAERLLAQALESPTGSGAKMERRQSLARSATTPTVKGKRSARA